MLIKNAKRWAPSGGKGYAISLFAFIIAFLLRYSLHGVVGDLVPYATFFVAALLIEYRYGLGPALLLAALSIPTGIYFFTPPFNTLSLADADVSDILAITGNAATMGLGIALIEMLQRARYESRLLAEVASTRYEVLLRSESERQSAVASARLTRDHFNTFTSTVGEVLYMKQMGGGFEYVGSKLAEISGRSAESLIGGQWLSIMHPEDATSIEEQMAQVLENHQPVLSEFRLRKHDDGYVVFEGKLSAMEDERGTVLRWTGGVQEVEILSEI